MKTELQVLEERLLEPAARRSRTALDDLLAEDFIEFGASGRVWSKADVLDHLPEAAPVGEPSLADFRERELASGCRLVTYVLTVDGVETLRSSVWRQEGGRWRMCFHQGTARR